MRVILHCDMNSFYASVEMLYQPHLRTVPLAVGGDEEKRHGIVLAKNEWALSLIHIFCVAAQHETYLCIS